MRIGPKNYPASLAKTTAYTARKFLNDGFGQERNNYPVLAWRTALMDIINSTGRGGSLAMDSFNEEPLHCCRSRELVNTAMAAAPP